MCHSHETKLSKECLNMLELCSGTACHIQDLRMMDDFMDFKKHCKLYFMESKSQY